MNTYIEKTAHYTLPGEDYSPLLRFCIEAAVNILASFPDVPEKGDGGFIPFEEKVINSEEGYEGRSLLFGNGITGIEVRVIRQEGAAEGPLEFHPVSITAETYGMEDKGRVFVRAFRGPEDTWTNSNVELEVNAPESIAPVIRRMFCECFRNSAPGDEKLSSMKSGLAARLRKGMWDSAADDALYILDYSPDDPEAFMYLGIAKGASGDWRSAKKNLLTAAVKLPGRAEIWYSLGLAYRNSSDNINALKCFEKVIDIDPLNHAAYFMKGEVLRETGREDEAVAAFRYSIKYPPGAGGIDMLQGEDFSSLAVEALLSLGYEWKGGENLPEPDGADINEDLVRASYYGDVKKAERLLLEGANADYRSRDESMHGRTPLIVAAINGHLSMVKYLLENGAEINFADANGCGPLCSVMEWGNCMEMVEFLISNGADINVKDPYGRPLILNWYAIENPEIILTLAGAGADLNAADEHGSNGVLFAAAAGSIETVGFFIEHGLDINSRDKEGLTPLMAASLKKDHELISYLLKMEADKDITDHEGRTALMFSAAAADPAGLELLIDAGADVNIRDGMGRSAIDILMESGDRGDMPAFRKCVSLLTDAGAELVHGLYDEN
ncbi:MAG TPA: ankyrin repeat domain-containing protein [Spirochaetota bacterium]|nr:ankyrin repeat domain-containing protein [Spirochaetota bacterium]